MALDNVLFECEPVTVLTVRGAERFLARLVASDLSRLTSGHARRTVMLNATGNVIGKLYAVRTDADAVRLVIAGEDADAREAWVRQVAAAFDAEVAGDKGAAFCYTGALPVQGLQLEPGGAAESLGLVFMRLKGVSMVAGPAEAVQALRANLLQAGARAGDAALRELMRILACEPAAGQEFDSEEDSPLECGFEDAVDLEDASRVFIGRALTEARKAAGNHAALRLVAFEKAIDPGRLTETPYVFAGEEAYPFSSLARIEDMGLTAGLVRLPLSVGIGSSVALQAVAGGQVLCDKGLVLAPQG
ncbi:MAG: hypothetical protein HUK26_04690 [Duodenibacillus sp.]|nr:hypothetical protein [Duodenibacillus sp.]